MKRALFFIAVAVFFASISPAAPTSITYNIDATGSKTRISPYIYGTNSTGNSDYTIVRSGGNRLTAYNWENNWSNAGADWYFENDQYMSSSTIPGKAITDFRDSCVANHQDSIVTLQMAGYVSAALWRQINLATEAAPSIYFKNVVFAKGAPFCNPPGSPNTADANVYMDEFVNFLVSRYGYAGSPNGVKFYDMDNEPDIWSDGNKGATHPEVHPAQATCAEYKDKSVAISLAVKNVDPNAKMLGPVSYGFGGYLTFQGAPDWKAPLNTGYSWFLTYYLDKMRVASNTAGKRLLDALDLHWYPETQDGAGNRITNTVNTNAMYNARMQAPRTLWDTSYVYPNGEISWINQSWFVQYLPLLPRLKADIAQYYPDTNLTFTEYDYGAQNHWSGGIATSDVLGIFGKYGVYLATYWGGGSYVDAAIKMYRNYDGAHSVFGDMNVPATTSDKVKSSIYASVFDGNDYEIHLIVINKDINDAINGTFNITSTHNFTTGRVWAFDSNASSITERAAISNITNNTFTYTVGKLSVSHIVLKAPVPPACNQVLEILDYNLVDQNRISRTEFEYTFRLHAANSSIYDACNVTIRLVAWPDNTLVLNDTVHFTNVPAMAESFSDDTFKIRTDRTVEGLGSDIVWQICDCTVERKADLNHDGVVNFVDFAAFAETWSSDTSQDVYTDGSVNITEVGVFSEEWLK
jgi:Glycoside hydrolase family 44